MLGTAFHSCNMSVLRKSFAKKDFCCGSGYFCAADGSQCVGQATPIVLAHFPLYQARETQRKHGFILIDNENQVC
jgi:hypothetical protein